MMDHRTDSKRSEKSSANLASLAANRVFPVAVIQRFNEVVHEAETLSFITRDSDLQAEAIVLIESLVHEMEMAKQKLVEAEDEEGANATLALLCLLNALRCELEMWLRLKCGEPEAAWDLLVAASESARAAICAHECGEIAENRLPIYQNLERFVFPPQVYSSLGGVVTEEHCSICGRSYDTCPHIKGRAYMGEFCSQIITRWRLREVSIVPQPRDKRCRVTHFSDKEGSRNRMTWKLEVSDESGPEQETTERFRE